MKKRFFNLVNLSALGCIVATTATSVAVVAINNQVPQNKNILVTRSIENGFLKKEEVLNKVDKLFTDRKFKESEDYIEFSRTMINSGLSKDKASTLSNLKRSKNQISIKKDTWEMFYTNESHNIKNQKLVFEEKNNEAFLILGDEKIKLNDFLNEREIEKTAIEIAAGFGIVAVGAAITSAVLTLIDILKEISVEVKPVFVDVVTSVVSSIVPTFPLALKWFNGLFGGHKPAPAPAVEKIKTTSYVLNFNVLENPELKKLGLVTMTTIASLDVLSKYTGIRLALLDTSNGNISISENTINNYQAFAVTSQNVLNQLINDRTRLQKELPSGTKMRFDLYSYDDSTMYSWAHFAKKQINFMNNIANVAGFAAKSVNKLPEVLKWEFSDKSFFRGNQEYKVRDSFSEENPEDKLNDKKIFLSHYHLSRGWQKDEYYSEKTHFLYGTPKKWRGEEV